MAELIPPDLTVLDRVALSWFLLSWLGDGLAIHATRWGGSIAARMHDVRRAWMRAMLARDNRITDASLIGHTVHSATVVASTTMVALAALLGILGAFDRSVAAPDALPIATVLSLAIRSFNAGVRGYLLALAVLTWLLGLAAFLLATTGIVLMLLWRQFGSATAVAIRHRHAALVGVRPASHPALDRLGHHSAVGVNGFGRAIAMPLQP